jgi:diguanylate cyclase (GGDEF)-like protein/PAS domain S-box-containing protein
MRITNVNDLGLPHKNSLHMAVQKENIVLKSILEKANAAISPEEMMKIKEKWMQLDNSQNYTNDLSNEEREYLKKKKKILMCVLPNWLPFEQIDENGQYKGIGADFMKIVSKYMDTPIELLPTKEWSESLQNIKDRKCDILPVAMDIPSRRDAMNFTRPYVSEPFVIATRHEEFFIKDVKQLSNRKIGVVKSYAFIDVLKKENPSIKIIDVKNTKDGLEKVSSGELFGYIDAMPTIGYGIQKYSMLDLKIAGKLEFDIKLSVATRNDEPLLHSIMQKAIDTISEEQKRTIVGRWISIKIAQEFDYTVLWKISIVFIVILFAILYKNRAVGVINKKLLNANKEIQDQQIMVDKYVLILNTDLNGVITSVNDAYCKSIGFSRTEMIRNTHSMMKHPDMKTSFFDDMWSVIKNDNIWNGELKNLTKNGDTVWFLLNIEPIINDGKKVGYRSISENITDRKNIEKLSVTDQLTQLYNRHKLEKSFRIEIQRAKRNQNPFSVILLDIDYFKCVNDKYGHDIGDETLKSVAFILKNNIRITDIIGRWGGEEFLIIAPDTNADNAILLAEKIRKRVESFDFQSVGNITACFGVATFMNEDTKETLIKKSDIALYKAKANGRNKVEIFR